MPGEEQNELSLSATAPAASACNLFRSGRCRKCETRSGSAFLEGALFGVDLQGKPNNNHFFWESPILTHTQSLQMATLGFGNWAARVNQRRTWPTKCPRLLHSNSIQAFQIDFAGLTAPASATRLHRLVYLVFVATWEPPLFLFALQKNCHSEGLNFDMHSGPRSRPCALAPQALRLAWAPVSS